MLRIEEIVGCMDDEFRYALGQLDGATLAALRDDQRALRRMRPVGVSHGEAVAMIDAILDARAKPPPSKRIRPPRAAASPRRRKVGDPAPQPLPEAPRQAAPLPTLPLLPASPRPACLPPPPGPVALLPPPAIRLPPALTAPQSVPSPSRGWLARLRAAISRLVNRLR